MKLAMILGRWSTGLHGKLSPEALYKQRALTGSESSFFNMARALSERGHQVHIYCDTAEEKSEWSELGGAKIFSIDREIPGFYDVYIALNEPDQLKRAPSSGKLRICWQQLGDFPGNSDPGFDSYVDRYVALSPRHMDYIIGASNSGALKSTREKWCWAPNSINLDLIEEAEVEVKPGSMVWCSSPDRGLHRLLEIFPKVKEKVPGAALDIYYRFDPWYERAKTLSDPTGDRARYIGECLSRLGRNGENGVRVWGPVSNVEMAKKLRQTMVLPYTCDCLRFTETFSVSIMDACLAGCVPIISDEDAIGEIYESVAVVLPGKPGTQRKTWIDTLTYALSTPEWVEEKGDKANKFAKNFDRNIVVKVWEEIILGKIPRIHSISDYLDQYGDKRQDWISSTFSSTFSGTMTRAEEPRKAPEVTEAELPPPPVPTVEVVNRPLRIAVSLGKTGSAVHGVLDVEKVFTDDGAFATGTVTGFFNVVWGLADRGHTIDAFCECKESVLHSPTFGGANFYSIDTPPDDTYDAYISINEPDVLKGRPKDKLKITALWLNDFSYCSPGWDEHVDVYACPSETHRQYIESRNEVPHEKLDVMPLCVSWELHDQATVRRPGSIAYCSSPDRGLHHILAMFPEIKAKVPHATLDVYYRVKPWYQNIVESKAMDGTHMRWRADTIKSYFDSLGEDGSGGVRLAGPVSPRRMAKALRETSVLAYPCDPVRFTEGFSAAILDACAAGCVPIIAGVDALPEIYGGSAHVIYKNPGERRDEWVKAIVLALTDEGFAAELRVAARTRAREFSRPKVAARWETLIRERMKKT